jgi:hypothetical protein
MREVPVGKNGHVALVDDDDYALVSRYTWSLWSRPNGRTVYARTHVWRDGKRTTIRMHTMLTGYRLTDHINYDGLDNQRSNLRAVTHHQSNQHRRKQRGASSQYRGVSWHRDLNKWVARLRVDGVLTHLGYCESEMDAALAYDEAARTIPGQELNFPAAGE